MPDEPKTWLDALTPWALAAGGGLLTLLTTFGWRMLNLGSGRRKEAAEAGRAEVDVVAGWQLALKNERDTNDAYRAEVRDEIRKLWGELKQLRQERDECEARSAAQAIEIERAKAAAQSAEEKARIVGERYDVIEEQLLEITRKAGERGYTDIFGVALILLMLGAMAHVTLAGMAMKPPHPPPVAMLPASKR